MLHENIHAKTFAQMDSTCADQFRSFVIDKQHFKYEANTSAFLKDLKFSIKVSDLLGQIARPWNVRVKKKNNNNNKQTNKKNKMNLFLLQKYTTLNFSITTAAIA